MVGEEGFVIGRSSTDYRDSNLGRGGCYLRVIVPCIDCTFCGKKS